MTVDDTAYGATLTRLAELAKTLAQLAK